VPDEYVQLRSAINLIGNTHEELGILVKEGIVDERIFIDRYSWVIARQWARFEPFVAYIRAVVRNDAIWENFEYLTVLSQDFMREHPSTYPKGVRRLQPHNPWPLRPLPSKPATA
jgi:hypothetical protein